MPKKTPISSEQAFEKAYAADAKMRDEVLQALTDACFMVDFPEEPPASWQEVLTLIASDMGPPTVETIAGHTMPGAAAAVYALATYGWDGGNAITTNTIGLDTLVSSDAFGGPHASVVARTQPHIPGLAVQFSEADESLTLQFF